MATKTLSQLVGGGGGQTGDLVQTTASTTSDGKTLLDCDGSAFNTGTYPNLATVISAGRGMGQFEYWVDGQGVWPSLVDHFAVSPDGTQCICVGNDYFGSIANGGGGYMLDKNVTYTSSAGSSLATGTDCCGGAYFFTEARKGFVRIDTATLDIRLVYDTADDNTMPISARVIDTTDQWDGSETTERPPCQGSIVISSNGQDAVFGGVSNANVRLGIASNAGGFEADVAWAAGATSTTAIVGEGHLTGYGVGNGDVSTTVWPTNYGIYVSTDGGSNFSQTGKYMPNGTTAIAVAMDSSDNIYAVSRNQVAKSTDNGANWSKLFNITEVNVIRPNSYGDIRLVDVKIDSSNRIYVLGYSTTIGTNYYLQQASDQIGASASNSNMNPMHFVGSTVAILFLSTDAGSTWTHHVMGQIPAARRYTDQNPRNSSSNHDRNNSEFLSALRYVTPEFLRMQIKSDGSALYVNDMSGHTLWETTITAGSFLPYFPGYKIVAD